MMSACGRSRYSSRCTITVAIETTTKLSQAIDSAYDIASKGLPGFPGAEELARNYQRKNREGKNRERENREREKAIDDLIKWQVMGAGASGLITGLPGITTLPSQSRRTYSQ
jgi:hypothetical protein